MEGGRRRERGRENGDNKPAGTCPVVSDLPLQQCWPDSH